MTTKNSMILGALATLIACGEGTNEAQNGLFGTTSRELVTRAEAEDLGVGLLGGRVLASEQDTERGVKVFEIDVLRPSGSVVEITIEVESGLVVEVESNSPAPGDDLAVGEGLLTLLEAIDIATRAQPGTVVGWEIERDEAGEWTWEIELDSPNGDEVEIEINAASGAADIDDVREPWDEDDIEADDLDDDYQGELAKAISDAALTTVAGTIADWERYTSDGFVRWEVDVRTASGAVVEIELLGTSGRILEASGDEGPFDYTFEPSSYISLAEALSAAEVASNNLAEWTLEREDGRLLYELETEAGEDVYVDAVTALVIAESHEDSEAYEDDDDVYDND